MIQENKWWLIKAEDSL